MPEPRSSCTYDALGRPLVAGTGIGIVTVLGRGATENWDETNNCSSRI
ncbi:hypothetical protein MKK50_01115 [Methylobacterium sp. J-043]|nr:hypothetical protein [Methylobacterium sp. J-043]